MYVSHGCPRSSTQRGVSGKVLPSGEGTRFSNGAWMGLMDEVYAYLLIIFIACGIALGVGSHFLTKRRTWTFLAGAALVSVLLPASYYFNWEEYGWRGIAAPIVGILYSLLPWICLSLFVIAF